MTLIFLHYTGKLSFIPQCFSNRTHHKNIYTSLKKKWPKKIKIIIFATSCWYCFIGILSWIFLFLCCCCCSFCRFNTKSTKSYLCYRCHFWTWRMTLTKSINGNENNTFNRINTSKIIHVPDCLHKVLYTHLVQLSCRVK